MQKTKILLATNNQGKMQEFKKIYADFPQIEFLTPSEMGIELEVAETGSTYEENAKLKALAFAKASGMLCIADDSGLEVDALDGAPGVFSARFSPLPNATDADRREHLIAAIGRTPQPWTARFQCTLVIANQIGILGVYQGTCEGQILAEDRGAHGFGYDPCFMVDGYDKTMAEIPSELKNQISHRARAAQKTFSFFETLI